MRALDAGDALIEIRALIERGQCETTLDAMRCRHPPPGSVCS
jgi:hypothetical protein